MQYLRILKIQHISVSLSYLRYIFRILLSEKYLKCNLRYRRYSTLMYLYRILNTFLKISSPTLPVRMIKVCPIRLHESRSGFTKVIVRRPTFLNRPTPRRPSSIAGDLAGAALVIEDVGFLDVAELGAALRGAGDSGTDDTVRVKTATD